MIFYRLIKCSRYHFSLNGTSHIRNFFGTLTDKANHQMDITIICSDGIGNSFQ